MATTSRTAVLRAIGSAIVAVLALSCKPAVVTNEGLPNFFVVDDRLVFRSAQPKGDDWARIYARGIRRVLKLNFPTEGSDDGATAAGLEVHAIPMEPRGDQDVFDNLRNTFLGPTPAQLQEAEAYLESATPQSPILVHCSWGHDRTGYVIMRYRVLHMNWTKAQANEERYQRGASKMLHGINDLAEDWNGK